MIINNRTIIFRGQTAIIRRISLLSSLTRRYQSSSSPVEHTADTTSSHFSFRTIGLRGTVMENLAKSRLLVPTEIQQKVYKHIYDGRNAVMMAETGSGKTLAYTLPVISRLLDQKQHQQNCADDVNTRKSPRAVFIMPNQDMAHQTHSCVLKIAEKTAITSHCLPHLDMPKPNIPLGTDILVTTVNVASKLMQYHAKSLFSNTEIVIMDEVDWVLSEGYPYEDDDMSPIELLDQLKSLKYTGVSEETELKKKQFIFSCATLPKGPKSPWRFVTLRFPHIPFIFSSGAHQTVTNLKEHWIDIDSMFDIPAAAAEPAQTDTKEKDEEEEELTSEDIYNIKNRELVNILRENPENSRILVFGNTVESIDKAYSALKEFVESCPNLSARIRVDKLHSKVPKHVRREILPMFMKTDFYGDTRMENDNLSSNSSSSSSDIDIDAPKTHILVAGDSVARGYDFQHVSKVIQYDFATNVVTYLHRVGRTARAGKTGEVVNFVTKENEALMQSIRNSSAGRMVETKTIEDVYSTRYARLFSRNRSLRKRLRNKLKQREEKEED